MQKTENVKATKLLVDDHIKVGGVMYRITSHTLRFGRKDDRVSIHMRTVDKKETSLIMNVPSSSRFTIYNQ